MLASIGFPADAVKMFSEVLSDTEGLEQAATWGGGQWDQQAQTGLKSAMESLNTDKTVEATLRTLRTPRTNPKPGTSSLDLVLLINPQELDKAAVTSLFAESLTAAAGKTELLGRDSRQPDPDGRSPSQGSVPQIALALMAMVEGKAEAIDLAVGKLTKLVDETPMEDLSTGARPNARQRAEALLQVPLWLVARACTKHDSVRQAGDLLGARAIEAARRQIDRRWVLAILRERGQMELDRGDKTAAEKTWTRDARTRPGEPGFDEARGQTQPAASPAAPVPPPAPAPAPAPAAKPTGGKAAMGPKSLPATLDRFEQAAQISKLAASRGMTDLALRAIHEAMAGGPPVASGSVGQFGVVNSNRVIRYAPGQEPPDQTAIQVENRLYELEAAWKKAKIDPKGIYGVLRDAVLPESRPGEVFLYAGSQANAASIRQSRSVAALLAKYAVLADQTPDLRSRLDSRKGQPMAELSAMIMLGLVSLESKDEPRVAASLDDLKKRLERDTLRTTAGMACLIAVPALQSANLEPSARAVADLAAKNLQNGTANSNDNLLPNLLITLARHNFEHKDLAAGRKNLQDYVTVSDRGISGNADYSSYRKKVALQKVAAEALNAGLVDDALESMGQVADIPYSRYGTVSDGEVVPLLLRLIEQRPAAERYELLHKWSMPTANRKSIRLLAGFVNEASPPSAFGSFPLVAPAGLTSRGDGAGVASTTGLLIASAAEAGKLDALAAEVEELATQKVENAGFLRTLILLARNEPAKAEPAIKTLLAEIKEKFKPEKQPQTTTAIRRASSSTKPTLIDWHEYLIGRAAATNPATASLGDALLKEITGFGKRSNGGKFQTHAARDLIDLATARDGGSKTPLSADPGLKFWQPADACRLGRAIRRPEPGRLGRARKV